MNYQAPINSSPYWIHRLEDRAADDVVASRGTIVGAGASVSYYTTQPAAGQWVALSVVPLTSSGTARESSHQVIVGTGNSEADAIESLRASLFPVLSEQLVDTFTSAVQPSDWFG